MENLEDYLETYYEVVKFIEYQLENYVDSVPYRQMNHKDIGGLYELAKEWTDKFTEQYKDVVWGEESDSGALEYYDTIEEFLTQQNKL